MTDYDIKKMLEVISTPDCILFLGYDQRTQSNKFSFLKTNTNGTYNLLEVYGGRRGNMTVKTFFKTKKGINQRVMKLQKNNFLLPTSETYFGASLSSQTARIPTMLDPLPLDVLIQNVHKNIAKVVKDFQLTKFSEQKKVAKPIRNVKKRGFHL